MNAETPTAQLTYFIPEELYLLKADKDFYSIPRQPLIEPINEPDNTLTETPVLTFKYIGNNQKNFLILTSYPGAESISDTHLAALTSTLGRLNFSIADTAIVNVASYPDCTWTQLSEYFKPQKLLVLGKAAFVSGMPALPLNEIKAADSYLALYTFNFEEMIGQKETTKIFWNQIKTL